MPDDGRPNGMQERFAVVGGVNVRVSSYPVGVNYSCRVDNVDPGANIARAMGRTRSEAEDKAMEGARLALELRNATKALKEVTSKLRK